MKYLYRNGITAVAGLAVFHGNSVGLNIRGLPSFRSVSYFERYFLTFRERLKSAHIDRGKVGEQVFATIVCSNESEAFGIIEPFNCACRHKNFQVRIEAYEPPVGRVALFQFGLSLSTNINRRL